MCVIYLHLYIPLTQDLTIFDPRASSHPPMRTADQWWTVLLLCRVAASGNGERPSPRTRCWQAAAMAANALAYVQHTHVRRHISINGFDGLDTSPWQNNNRPQPPYTWVIGLLGYMGFSTSVMFQLIANIWAGLIMQLVPVIRHIQ